ncbi:MAG: N-acetyltransferase [Actinobacteria bacterium]|nr:N-acetyltransferase [Actinomycetota bacterium]
MDNAVMRMATVEDAASIAAIYAQAVATTTSFDLRPRSLDDQRRWLEERSGAYAAIVAVAAGEVAGFASLSPYKDRPAYSTTVEDSVYVDEAHQGQGFGRLLLGELLDIAEAHGFHCLIGRIGGHNEVSIRLHESFGFRLVGVEREVGRKFNRWLDVVVMQRILTEPPH